MSIKSEIEKLKPMTWQKRLDYLATYYKWHVIGILFGLVLIFGVVSAVMENSKETMLACSWVNESEVNTEVGTVADAFGAYIGIEESKQRLLFDNGSYVDPEGGDSYSMASQSRLSAMWADGDLDLIVCDETLAGVLSESDWFLDLTEALPAELYEVLQPYLLGLKGPDGIYRVYGIDITDSVINPTADGSTPYSHVLCVTNTSQRLETVWEFLKFLDFPEEKLYNESNS